MFLPMENYLYGTFFGNTLLQYIFALGIIGLSVLIGQIVFFFLRKYARKITTKTKTSIDDILLGVLEVPFILAIFTVGFFIGYRQLTLPESVDIFLYHITKNLITIVLAWIFIRLFDKMIDQYLLPLVSKTKSDLDDHIVPLLKKIVKIVIFVLAFIIILNNFGYNVTSLIAGLGIGGLAVALAAQEMLKNLFGGIAILTDKPFKIGDWVEIDKYSGGVVDIGLRSTRLRTVTGEYVTLPNSMITSTSTINYTKFPKKSVKFIIGLTYDTPLHKLEKAKKLIEQILDSNPRVTKEGIEINFVEFNSYSLDIDVRFGVDTNKGTEIRKIRDDINREIKKVFEKEKISIAFPTQTVYLNK